jgi:bifunctional enzyme CysN/CysC
LSSIDGERSLLRVATAGSVDDGKSTLIGRLLYDSKSLMTDALEAVQRTSARRGDSDTNLALVTDGLRAEREQGITIDVAYRYFTTETRSFILADTPGHVQYTANTLTGLSTSDVVIILVDARKGVSEQTRRHSFIAALVGVREVVLAVNKMDLVDWDEKIFRSIEADFADFASGLATPPRIHALPLSALSGDNVVDPSDATPWYEGLPLLRLLEGLEVDRDGDDSSLGARLAVQWVVRPQHPDYPDYRGYAGQLTGGILRAGDDIDVLPSRQRTTVAAIDTYDGPLEEAGPGSSITVRLADELDVGRGDLLVHAHAPRYPSVGAEIEAHLYWMSDRHLTTGSRWCMRHLTRELRAEVVELVERQDLRNLLTETRPGGIGQNELGRVRLRLFAPIAGDPYRESRSMGRFILIDEGTNATVGAGMLETIS